jgi:hypothetical protein
VATWALTGMANHTLRLKPSGLSPISENCEQSRSETLPIHLGSVLRSCKLGQMGITTSG